MRTRSAGRPAAESLRGGTGVRVGRGGRGRRPGEALEDEELKEEALRNKAIVEGIINDDDESSYERRKRWKVYDDTNHDREYDMDHEFDEM
nr:hypothetical protein [Tanacetum cinerariifolium]